MYTTLQEVKTYIKLESSTDDLRLKRLINQAEDLIDRNQGRKFYPRVETRIYDIPEDENLYFDDDLLEVLTLTNGDGSILTSSMFRLYFMNFYPKKYLTLRVENGYNWLYPLTGFGQQALQLKAIWGYHDRYETSAWISSQDALTVDSGSGTSLYVSDSGSAACADDGFSPRFQEGQLIKISSGSDFEFILVDSVSSGSSLEVKRAQFGTENQSWLVGSPLEIWRPPRNVWLATNELVRFLYNQATTNLSSVQQIVGTGIKITPAGLPEHVVDLLPAPRMSFR
jgi:hypothetical protein